MSHLSLHSARGTSGVSSTYVSYPPAENNIGNILPRGLLILDSRRDVLNQRVEGSLRKSLELHECLALKLGLVAHPPARRRWAAATFSSQSGTISSIGVPSRLPDRTASCIAASLPAYPGSEYATARSRHNRSR